MGSARFRGGRLRRVHHTWFGSLLLVWGSMAGTGRAEQTWVQTTDADFATGTRAGVSVSGIGEAANLTLAPATLAWKRAVTVTNLNAEALADFPVRIALNAANFDFSRTLPDGADIRFLDSDGTTSLVFWIESWDAMAQTAVVWVRLRSLGAGETRTIFLCYGDATAGAAASGQETFQHFDDFDTLSAWTQYNSTVTLANGIVTLDCSGAPSNPSTSTVLTAAAPFTVEVRYQQPSSFRNRLYLTKPGLGSPLGYDYGSFESLYWNGFSGVTLVPNTWYIMRWDNAPTDYVWRIRAEDGAEVFARSHGSAIADLSLLSISGTDSSNSDLKLDWLRVRPYAVTDPATSVGAESSAGAEVVLPAVGTFVSPAFDTGMFARLTLGWAAETPAGTAVRFQVQTAATQAGLAATGWRGPTGPADWFTASGGEVPMNGAPARWVQVKAALSTSTNGVSPRLNSVTVTYVPGDVTVTADAAWPEGDYVLGNLTVTSGSTLAVGGGSTLTAAGAITVTGNSTLLLQGKNRAGQVDGQWQGTGVTVRADSVTVDAGSRISADGQGYAEGQGPGGTGDLYSGGSHGGRGAGGSPGAVYGSADEPVTPGSAAMGEGGAETWGGGAIRLEVAGALQLDGTISANGAHRRTWWAEAIGGGAGGSVWVTAGSLAGAGRFTAQGELNGGGGRIAVYYGQDAGYAGFTTSTAEGAGGGQTGTCGFFETGVPHSHARIFQRFTWPQDSGLHFGALTVTDGAGVEVGGGSTIQVDGQVLISGNSTVLFRGKNTNGQVGGVWAGTGVTLQARDLTIAAGSLLSADGEGYATGQGPGATGDPYSGASYGGRGAGGSPGAVYGSGATPVDLGSGAGAEGGSRSIGGGAIRLEVSGTLALDGEITADGTFWQSWYYYAVGGSSGGSVWVRTGTLAGSGRFTACGSNKGGGGRIAVYYGRDAGFTGFTASGADGADGAQAGTIAFFDTGVPNAHLSVYQRFDWSPEARPHYGALTLGDGAVAELGGGAVLEVDGDVVITGASTLQVQSRNAGATVNGRWAGVGGLLRARNLRLDAGSVITVDEQGYRKYCGPGTWGDPYGGAAGHGGRGKNNTGAAYGSETAPIDLGSGGPAQGNSVSNGGGAIWLQIDDTLTLDGEVSADGGLHQDWYTNALSGASGGSVFITTGTLQGSGLVTANGSASGGGGGRIAVHTWAAQTMAAERFQALGRDGGQNGTVHFGTSPFFGWPAGADEVLHGSESIGWWFWGVDPAGVTVDVLLAGGATTLSLGTSLPLSTVLTVDTTACPDGLYELRATFRDAGGQILGEAVRQVLVANAVVWHSGVISTAETWTAGVTHGIEGNLWVVAGGQVTVEPGTVVKAVAGTLLTVETGGAFTALGAAGGPIVFTAITDDSLGGDTNGDGSITRPYPGYWNGLAATGTGALTLNAQTEMRYVRLRHSGILTADEAWLGGQVHQVTADLVIPSGRRLDLYPGAVVKLAPGTSVRVQAGGTLTALGALAQPIVITSERDDTIGGDTNGDGSTTRPAAGDWYRIHVEGTADFDHVQVRYGAGTDPATGYLIGTAGAGQVTIANSVLSDGLYTGVLSWGEPSPSPTRSCSASTAAARLTPPAPSHSPTAPSTAIASACSSMGARLAVLTALSAIVCSMV